MHNVLNVPSNWSNEVVGSGYIYRGHSDNSPNSAQPASTDDNDGYFNTSNTTGDQRRTLKLNNGEVVWDMSGNVWEWTAGTVSGGQPGASGGAWREWNAAGLTTGTFLPNSFPSFGTPAASGWTSSTNAIGRLYSNSTETGLRGIERGSFWNGGANAGITTLNFNDAPTTANNALGFRIAYEPLSTTSCSPGMVPVPGNSDFGTNRFCVGKYEAKNVGGVATSQPSGVPWVNISQTDAVTAANAACAKCRLIGEAEWLTIAHNILSVPSNWTGGAVGSGTVYRGHSDNGPAAAQVASADDNDGYSGTNSVSGNQRRTLMLNNGQIIWDFSGNVWEYTTGQIASPQPGDVNWVWREWNTVSPTTLVPNPIPSFGTPSASAWDSTNGLGKLYSNSAYGSLRAFLRSGNWSDSNGYGLFTLALNRSPDQPATDAGFRIVEIK